MTDLRAEPATASHFIEIVSRGRRGHPKQSLGGYSIKRRDGEEVIRFEQLPIVDDWHPAPVIHVAIDAVRALVTIVEQINGSHIHFLCKEQFFRDRINEGRRVHHARDYKCADGRPYSHPERWKELDDILDKFELQVSASKGMEPSQSTKGKRQPKDHLASRLGTPPRNAP